MKQIFALALLCGITVFGMPAQAQKKLGKVITLEIPGEDGSNSGSVVWHPVLKRYYTSMIGNATYAMAIFSDKGKLIEGDIPADHDYRGMWYNPATRRIEFNCYNDGGWGHLVLDGKGAITDKVIDKEGMNQPSDQSVGSCLTGGKSVLFLNTDREVVKYNARSGEEEGVLTKLYIGCKSQKEVDAMTIEDEEERWELRNKSVVIHTGIAKGELAILNTFDQTVELYNQKTGFLTGSYALPKDIAPAPSFNFSYSNGIWWFFNKEKRAWTGCK